MRFGLEHPRKDLEQNTIATFNVLEAMRANGIRGIAFSSTGSVYGEAQVFPTPEDAPFPVQTSLYGASKLAGEGLIAAYAKASACSSWIFRFVSILGERYTHGHVFDFYKQLLRAIRRGCACSATARSASPTCTSRTASTRSRTRCGTRQGKVKIFNLGTDEYCQVNDSIGWITSTSVSRRSWSMRAATAAGSATIRSSSSTPRVSAHSAGSPGYPFNRESSGRSRGSPPIVGWSIGAHERSREGRQAMAVIDDSGVQLDASPSRRPLRAVRWDGSAFVLDGTAVRVLSYGAAPSGWTDELTQLHEDIGGSDHFIDVASRVHAVDEVVRCAKPRSSKVLEVGCSSGFLLRELLRRLPGNTIVGSDYTQGTLRALAPQVPGVPLLQFDLAACPLPDAVVDIAVLLNVLEHIEDHAAAVSHLFRIVRPGGAVIIEVPAGPALYDVYDRVLMHHRRYAMRSLVSLIEEAGFIVERRSHLGFFLFLPFYLAKRLNQFRYPLDSRLNEQRIVTQMIASTRESSRLMNLVMRVEQMLRPYLYYPVGIRCLVTCRKPG